MFIDSVPGKWFKYCGTIGVMRGLDNTQYPQHMYCFSVE
jgi:hypothetical protein